MPDPSGTRFEASSPKLKRRVSLATLLVAGGALSLAAQAQSRGQSQVQPAADSNQAAVQAGIQAAVQDGLQTIQTAQGSGVTHHLKPEEGHASSMPPDPRILVAQNAPAPGSQAADQSTANATDQGQLQEVVVTGSIIARPSSETAESITTVSADELKDEGITSVEEALSRISANMTGNSYTTASSVTTFEGGGSYANLRGIGAGNTLVLLDGQRLAPNVVLGSGIDLNVIPFAAIDHIDVLKEGASSIYGTDAIGGVINFITRKNYQHAELDLNGTKPQDGGGGGADGNLTFGHGDIESDGYNFLLAGDFNYGAELRATQRPFSSTGFDPARGLTNTNNPGTSPGSYIDNAGNQYQVGWPACAGNSYLTRYYPGECTYLYSAAVDLIPKTSKASGLAAFTKALPGNNTLEIQYFFARSEVTSWGGPMTYAGGVDPASPYYPTAAESTCATAVSPCAGVPPALGGDLTTIWTDPYNSRDIQYVNTAQRWLATFSGNNGGWNYSTDFDFSLNHNLTYLYAFPNLSIIEPGNVFDPRINPFGPQSAAGEAVIQSAYQNGQVATGTYKLWSVDGRASHELGDAFNAGVPAAVAVGFDVMGESIDYLTTPLAGLTATSSGFFPTHTLGGRTEQAIYSELDVPMGKQVRLTISDREDRYSDFGTTNNGKLQLRYQPLQQLTFRGTVSTGFRAPSLFELYRPPTFGATGEMSNYPGCATGNYTTIFTASNCQAQGLALFGGNTNLQPLTSQNFDLGIIFEPIQGLGVTLDWYRILVRELIQTVPSTAIYGNPTTFSNYYVLNNAGTLTQAPSLALDCAPYTSPSCGYILQNSQNTGGLVTQGIDLSADYNKRTAFGNFHFSLQGTLVTEFQLQQYLDGPQLNLVGQWQGGQEPIMRWSHDLYVDWTYNRWGAGINHHFLSSYVDYGLTATGQTRIVGNYSIWGIYGSFRPIEAMTVMLGISNLFDTDPPFSNQGGGTNTNWQAGYNPIYSDPTGRAFYLRLKYQFL